MKDTAFSPPNRPSSWSMIIGIEVIEPEVLHNMPPQGAPGEESGKIAFLSKFRSVSVFIVFLFLAAYALGANPFSGQTVAPLDLIMSAPGWSSVQRVHKLVHWESSDIIDSQLPLWISLKEQIRAGRGALWWPYGTGGQPMTFELFNPTFLVFLAVKNNALAYYLAGLFKLVVSGFGGYLLLRAFLPLLPSVWGGAVFMLCGFNAAWFFWEHVATAMWIPWLLGAAVMYLRTEDGKWLPAITLASLLLILGGFPAVAAFGFYAFGLLVVFWNLQDSFDGDWRESIRDDRRRKAFFKRTALPFLAVSIAFLMSAIALIPFIDAMTGINLGHRAGASTHFGIRDLLLFFTYENPSEIERTAYIGILAAVFALVGLFSAFRTQDETRKRFIIFLAVLVAVSVSIAFGILPHRLIRSIPVFNTNAWGRLIVVPLLGLAALSSFGVDYCLAGLTEHIRRRGKISALNASRLVTVVLVLVTLVQFQSQKKLFNDFNAVVPSSWLYPLTPSIRYAKENLKPLQSAIADRSFNMAGTLGAYGIPQWFAHTFRTDKEKEILRSLVRDPFPSETSAFIDGGNILLDSPLMEKLAIKFLLIHKDVLEDKAVFEPPSISPAQAPPLPGNSWRQRIRIPEDMRIGYIGFLFATYPDAQAPANVRLALARDADGKILAVSELDRYEIADNKVAYFRFPDPVFLEKGDYSLGLSLVGQARPGKLTAWATRIPEGSRNYFEVNGNRSEYSLKWRIVEFRKKDPAIYSYRWKPIDLEPDILILENTRVTGGAYFVEDLDAANRQIDFSRLALRQPSSGAVEIDYSGGDAGWIVLPMHLHRGWKAYVQDRQVPHDAYLGILPAIPVQGVCTVRFRFEPDSVKTGAFLSAAGVLLFALFGAWTTRYRASRQRVESSPEEAL